MTNMLPRRQLGSTGLNVPVLGFGASPLGGIYNLASLALAARKLLPLGALSICCSCPLANSVSRLSQG